MVKFQKSYLAWIWMDHWGVGNAEINSDWEGKREYTFAKDYREGMEINIPIAI